MKLNFYIIIGIIFFILTWLFTGLFRDNEFNELSLFSKHKPTFKIYFYQPSLKSTIEPTYSLVNQLSLDEEREKKAYFEFVANRGLENENTLKLWYLPLILIQLTLTFLTFGFYRYKLSFDFKKWQLPTHFLINLIFAFLVFIAILVFDKLVWVILLAIADFLLNYFVIVLLTRKQKLEIDN